MAAEMQMSCCVLCPPAVISQAATWTGNNDSMLKVDCKVCLRLGCRPLTWSSIRVALSGSEGGVVTSAGDVVVVPRAIGRRIHGSTGGAFLVRFGFGGYVVVLSFGLGGLSRCCEGGGETSNGDDERGAVVLGMSS